MGNQKPHILIPLFEELRGESVVVRPYRESDAQAIYEARVESRDHIRPWEPWADEQQTVQEQQALLAQWMAEWLLRKNLYVGYWQHATERYLGSSGIHVHSWDTGSFEIGYWVRASETGKGYVTETVKLLTDFAFTHLNASRVEIRCDERNERSAAVAKRLGYVQEARLRNNKRNTSGQLCNTLIFSMTPEDRRQR
jgi:RimJ/RimL family protein N-acetyltransferase